MTVSKTMYAGAAVGFCMEGGGSQVVMDEQGESRADLQFTKFTIVIVHIIFVMYSILYA